MKIDKFRIWVTMSMIKLVISGLHMIHCTKDNVIILFAQTTIIVTIHIKEIKID
jgi:hypothetical protein